MFMGIGNKWKNWKPSADYLSYIKFVDTVPKLHSFMQKFTYKWDTITILFWKVLWDNWQMPDESLKKYGMKGDCEDAAILALDILGRIQKKEDAKLIVSFGYRMIDNKRKYDGHVVTAFDNSSGKYDIFTNNTMEYNFDDLLDIGHRFYPLGLKYQEIRDWRGKVLSRKFKLFGVF